MKNNPNLTEKVRELEEKLASAKENYLNEKYYPKIVDNAKKGGFTQWYQAQLLEHKYDENGRANWNKPQTPLE
jgi:predicted alpha-1,6-mannanase (GH76 family)